MKLGDVRRMYNPAQSVIGRRQTTADVLYMAPISLGYISKKILESGEPGSDVER